MKDPGRYANPINSSFQKFRTTRSLALNWIRPSIVSMPFCSSR